LKGKGASPPNLRPEDQDREGSITTKYQLTRSGKRRKHHHRKSGQKIRKEKGASPPNISLQGQDREGSITTKDQVRRSG